MLTSSCVCDSSDSSQPQMVQSEILKQSPKDDFAEFTIRKFNNHTYVIFIDGHYPNGMGAAMVHDPDCKCNMK